MNRCINFVTNTELHYTSLQYNISVATDCADAALTLLELGSRLDRNCHP